MSAVQMHHKIECYIYKSASESYLIKYSTHLRISIGEGMEMRVRQIKNTNHTVISYKPSFSRFGYSCIKPFTLFV